MLEARTLCKSYGSTEAVQDVSLQVHPGDTLVIQGESGSGKTTLLRLLAGLEKPDRGTILQSGQIISSPEKMVAPYRRALGFVFQEAALWPHLTVAGHIGFGLQTRNQAVSRKRVDELAEELKIHSLLHRFPHELSGGQARRVAIGRSLAPQPALLLLDEPLVHLDPDLAQSVMTVIRREMENSKSAVVVVTHDDHEAHQWGGSCRRMMNGRLE